MAKAEEKDTGPVEVIASQLGEYGKTERYVGERFHVARAEHVSKRWMIRADDESRKDEIKRLELEFKQGPGRLRQQDVSQAQMLAEVAQSGGALAALRAENAQLKAEIAELKGAVKDAKGKAAAVGGGSAGGEDAPGAGGEASTTRAGGQVTEGDVAGGDADDQPTRTAPTRRRRSAS